MMKKSSNLKSITMNKVVSYRILLHEGSIMTQDQEVIDYILKRLNKEGRQYKERSTFGMVKITLVGDDET